MPIAFYSPETPVKYVVRVNWDGNTNWTGTTNDISSYVKKVTIDSGFTNDLEHIAHVGTCEIVVDNVSKTFSPFNSSSPIVNYLAPGKFVVIFAAYPSGFFDGSVFDTLKVKPIFSGVIKSIEIMSNTKGSMEAKIMCEDFIGILSRSKIDVNLGQNVTSNELIQMYIDAAFNQLSLNFGISYTDPNNWRVANGNSLAVSCYSQGQSSLGFSTLTTNGVSPLRSLGGSVYYWRTTLTGAPNEILIGSSTITSIYNFCCGYNKTRYWLTPTGVYDSGGAGVGYSTNFYQIPYLICNYNCYVSSGGTQSVAMSVGFGGIHPVTIENGYICFLSTVAGGSFSYKININGTIIDEIIFQQGDVGNVTGNPCQAITGALPAIANGIFMPSPNYNNTYLYASDDVSASKTTALEAIKKVVEAENGKFWQNGAGYLQFISLKDIELFNNGNNNFASRVVYRLGVKAKYTSTISYDKQFNESLVSHIPRATTAANVVVAKSPTQIVVPGQSGVKAFTTKIRLNRSGGSVIKRLNFSDPATGQLCGAMNLLLPLVAGTDYTVNERADGSGVDYTAYSPQQLHFTYTVNSNFIELYITNIALGPLYISNLQVRGTAITHYNEISYSVYGDDIYTQALKTTHSHSIKLPVDDNFAQSLANWWIMKYNKPIPRITDKIDFGNVRMIYPQNNTGRIVITTSGLSIGTLESSPTPASVYAPNLFDIVQLSDPQLGEVNTYYQLLGYHYTFSEGGALDTQFKVENTITNTFYQLDNTTFGLLDNTNNTVLGI